MEKELARVTEICDGCRRCHRLCPSFDHMLERVDAHEGDVAGVMSVDYRRVVDLCWQCKLCFNHCPYTPPHRFDIDFPRLMLRAKAARTRREGSRRQDAWLGNVDAVGSFGSAMAPLAGRHREGTLATDFPGRGPGKVAYQMPCHLRAQNMGYKTRDVLQLIPGTKVTVVERCTAMDGTWAMKKEFYPISLQFARKAVREMDAAEPTTYATDCSMAVLQIEEVRGVKPAHPATLLRQAYGLPEKH